MIKIAVDAMGGESSPKKIIDGIIHKYKINKDIFYKIFGDEHMIKKLIDGTYNLLNEISYFNSVKSTDSPLEAAKRGKDTSMWLSS